MLQVRDLTYRIGSKTLLHQVNTDLHAGALVAIIGPNGAGKSTLLHFMAGLLKAKTGFVHLEHFDLKTTAPAHLAKRRAILTQKTHVDAGFTLREVVMMGRYPHFGKQAKAEDHAIVEAALGQHGLAALAEKPFNQLSGGEQQRGHLARAYCQLHTQNNAPKLLLLDEPLNNLDIRHQHDTLERSKQFAAEGHLVIAVIHDINLAARYADQLLLMHQGRLLGQGAATQVLSEENLRKAFAIDVLVEKRDDHSPQVHFKPECSFDKILA